MKRIRTRGGVDAVVHELAAIMNEGLVVSVQTDQAKATELTVHSTPKLSQKGQAWQNGFVAVSSWREVGRVAAPV